MHSCFVISPIGATGTPIRQDMDDLLDLIIRPALERYDFDVKRGDHRSEANQIDIDVIESVQNADLCIVEISYQNPNVFYEMGRRDETGKPLILLKSKNSGDLPIDIATRRYIEYDLDDRHGIRDAITQLKNFVAPLVEGGFASSSSGASLSDLASILARIERKVDRLNKTGSTVMPAAAVPAAAAAQEGVDDLSPSEMFRLGRLNKNIPMIDNALQRLSYTTDAIKFFDNYVEVASNSGSLMAGEMLIEKAQDFMDSSATFHQKVDFLGSLVGHLTRQDKEPQYIELVEGICSQLLAESAGKDTADIVSIHNQKNRFYYGCSITANDNQWASKAVEELEVAIRLSPNKSFLHFNLATCSRQLGDLQRAKEAIDRTLELDKEPDLNHMKTAVELYYRMGLPEYEDLLEQMRQVNPAKAALTEAGLKR